MFELWSSAWNLTLGYIEKNSELIEKFLIPGTMPTIHYFIGTARRLFTPFITLLGRSESREGVQRRRQNERDRERATRDRERATV